MVLPPALQAQQGTQYVFTHYNTINGVASNFVNNLVQDYKGFIWISTLNGLQRYDGHKFLSFRNQTGNPKTVPSDNIDYVYEDSKQRLWVVTADNRAGIFNTQDFSYSAIPIHYAANTPLNLDLPKRLFETADGTLVLFVSRHGTYVLDEKKKAFYKSETVLPWPRNWSMNRVTADLKNNLYWMASDSGLAVFNPATRQLSYRGHNVANNPFIAQFANQLHVVEVYVPDGQRMYLNTWPPTSGTPELLYYDRANQSAQTVELSRRLKLGYHEINGHLKQKNDRFWLFGLPFIAEVSRDGQNFYPIKNEYRDEQSIKFDKVNSMFEDREQNIWICTDNGIFLFNPDAQIFKSYLLSRNDSSEGLEAAVQDMAEIKNGEIWIGSWGRGLFCYDQDFTPVPPPPSLANNKEFSAIWCIHQHSKTGLVWFGMQEGGLGVYDPATGRAERFSSPVFKGKTIRQVTEDKEGNLWFGTHGGQVIRWRYQEGSADFKTGYSLFFKKSTVHKMYTDDRGSVWVATLGHGLFRIDPVTNTFKQFSTRGTEGQRLSADGPCDVLQYNDSILLVANGAVNVINLNTNAVSFISAENGLPSNNALCLQKDQFDLVWIGMINGLCRVNMDKNIFIYYDRRDGITYDNFNMAGAYKLSNGKLTFTTDHDFLVFDPAEVAEKTPPPDVKITDFIMANRPLLVDSLNKLSRITLTYNKNSVVIGFGTLSYLRKNKKVFYYQMENFDKDWILSDDRHVAVYNYIPPGNYRFLVKAVNSFGQTSRITVLQIYIKQPFWNTWWFYSMLALAAIAVFYWIDRERMRRFNSLHDVRTEIAGNLHHDINTTLQNIHLLSEIAKMKADKDLAKSKEYIDQINTKSRRMIDDMDDMLWSIDPQNDSMQKTLERMNEFSEGLKNAQGCVIKMVVDEKVKSLKLDMKTRHEIFFIFKEALNNIVQHSDCTDSIISIDLVKSTLYIKIHDNGSGFELTPLHQTNGLKEMKKRAGILNAVLDIQSDKKGTSVILKVPVAEQS